MDGTFALSNFLQSVMKLLPTPQDCVWRRDFLHDFFVKEINNVLTNNLEDHSDMGSSRFRLMVLQSDQAVEGSLKKLSSEQTFDLALC